MKSVKPDEHRFRRCSVTSLQPIQSFFNPLEQNHPIPSQTANLEKPDLTRFELRDVIDASRIPKGLKVILQHLLAKGGPEGISFKRQTKKHPGSRFEGVAESTNSSRSSVTRAIRASVAQGWLRVERRRAEGGKYTLNHYLWCYGQAFHHASNVTHSSPYKGKKTVFTQQAEATPGTRAAVRLPSAPRPPEPEPATQAARASVELRAVLRSTSKDPLSDTSIRTIISLAKGDTEALEAWAWDRARKRGPLNSGGGIVQCIRDGEVIHWRHKIDHCRQLEAEAATREAEYQARQARIEVDGLSGDLTPTPPTTDSPRPTQAADSTEVRMSTPTTPARIPYGVKRELDRLETLAEYAKTPQLRTQHLEATAAILAKHLMTTTPDLAKFAGVVN